MRASIPLLLLSLILIIPGSPTSAQQDPLEPELNHEIALAGQEGFGKPEPGAASRSLDSPDNAAPIYREIARTLGPQPGLSWYWPLSFFTQRAPLSPEQLAQARNILKEQREALALAHRAATRPYCLVALDPDPSQDGYVALLPAMRASARILCAESAVQLAYGHTVEAIEPLVECSRIAQQTFASNRLNDTVIGEEIEEMALASLQRVLYAAGGDKRVCTAVAEACGAIQLPDMVTMLHRELAFAISANNWNAAHPHDTHEGAPGTPRLDFAALAHERRESLLRIVRALRALQPLVQLPYHVAMPKLTAIIQQLKPGEDADNYYDGYVLDMHRTALTTGARLMAYRSVIEATADILAFKAFHSTFPATLEQATPHPPPDPFTGAPISYRRESTGFVVYSKGSTGRYEGAVSIDRRTRNEVYLRYP
jgi:hypothetical protein